jgi:chromosome segregation ATPase
MIGAMDKDVKFQGNVVRDIVEPNNVELGRIKENLDVLCATGQLQNRKLESIQQHVDAIRDDVSSIKQVQGRTEQDIGMMRASLDRLDQRQDRTEQDVGVIKERLDRLDQRQDRTDQRQDRTEQDVGLIKQDVGLIKERLDRLDQDVGLIKQDVGVIKERLDRLHDLLLQIVSHHNPGASNGDIPQNPQA